MFKGFKIINKETGRPITGREYKKFWLQEREKYRGTGYWKTWMINPYDVPLDDVLDPVKYGLFLGANGRLYELCCWDYDIEMVTSDVWESGKLEIKFL